MGSVWLKIAVIREGKWMRWDHGPYEPEIKELQVGLLRISRDVGLLLKYKGGNQSSGT